MTYLVKGKIKGSGGRGKEKLEIRNVNVRSITLTENQLTLATRYNRCATAPGNAGYFPNAHAARYLI